MDRITTSYLEGFRKEQSLPKELPQPDLFELFAVYCSISNVHDEEFDTADLHTGGGNDLGIDGLAVIVNGAIVTSGDEVEDLLALNGFLDVKFVFIQAKSASNFSDSEIGSLFDGVIDFFSENLAVPVNEKIAAAREVMDLIYENSIKFKGKRPIVDMSFVTTGKWSDDEFLRGRVERRRKDLLDSGQFRDVIFRPMGAADIQDSYQRSKNNIEVEFNFVNKTLIPDIDGVSEAYLGVVPAREYLALITDVSGNIRRPLFYDNLRDFQGENEVNAEIKETLEDPIGQQRFAVLNNGVTLVARELKTTKNRFSVSDYQIVNGCQTSHVLFNVRESLGEEIYIPLKVVATTDEEIINSIIIATNRQTEVTSDDLFSRGAFQKSLEALYDSYPDKKKLHYERRSKQYASTTGIEKVRIIGKSHQIRAFAAMFLDEAHKATRYYSDLRALVGARIFNDQHKKEPYYAAAYGYYKIEYLWRNSSIPVYYKPARYQLLMALRYVIKGPDMPALTANKMTKFADDIAEVLWSDGKSVDAFKLAIAAVDTARGKDPLTRDLVKTQSFTDSVKAAAKSLGGST